MKYGNPTLLYFTTVDCNPWRILQHPVIQQLQEILPGNLNLVEVDAISNAEMVKQRRLLSISTIFFLNSEGQPHHINHGIASKEKLLMQLNSLSL